MVGPVAQGLAELAGHKATAAVATGVGGHCRVTCLPCDSLTRQGDGWTLPSSMPSASGTTRSCCWKC